MVKGQRQSQALFDDDAPQPKSAKKASLLDEDDGDAGEPVALKVNEAFAKRFEVSISSSFVPLVLA